MLTKYISVLHHTNFGGCERLALDFNLSINSDSIIFHPEEETIDSRFLTSNVRTTFLPRISIRSPIGIWKIHKSMRGGKSSRSVYILWHGRFSLLATYLALADKDAFFVIHIGTKIEESSIFERISLRVLRGIGKRRIKFVCVSSAVQQSFLKSFPFLSSLQELVNNGIPAPLNGVNPNADDYNFASVSRFDDSKFQDLIIRTLKERKLNEKVHFIGDGINLEKCRELAKNLDLESSVTFSGNLREPFSFLRTSQIFIFAADEREGFGLVLYEAILRGMRVIASDISASRSIIEDKNFLFQNEESSLSRCINFSLHNADYHASYMLRLRNSISKNYSVEEMHRRYLNIWEQQ